MTTKPKSVVSKYAIQFLSLNYMIYYIYKFENAVMLNIMKGFYPPQITHINVNCSYERHAPQIHFKGDGDKQAR